MQGLLNSVEGVMIKGENANIFAYFYEAYRELLFIQEKHSHATSPVNPWFGSCWFNAEQYKQDLHLLGKNLLLQTDHHKHQAIHVFGFKEIRYATMADPISFINFLLEVFPQSCVIHLTRNHEAVAASQQRKFRVQQYDPSSIVSKLRLFDESITDFGNDKPFYFGIDYSDLKDPELSQVKALFQFLGAPFNEEQLRMVLDKPHSY